MFDSIGDLLSSPSFWVAVGLFMGALKAVGELCIKLGNMGKYAADDQDWFDSIGAFLKKASDGLGKILAFFGPGNRQK